MMALAIGALLEPMLQLDVVTYWIYENQFFRVPVFFHAGHDQNCSIDFNVDPTFELST